jgi:hypothetical protein
MSSKSFLSVAGIIFLIVAGTHFLRVVSGWEVGIHTLAMPMWFSWVAFPLIGFLAYQGLRKR